MIDYRLEISEECIRIVYSNGTSISIGNFLFPSIFWAATCLGYARSNLALAVKMRTRVPNDPEKAEELEAKAEKWREFGLFILSQKVQE
jgi:hypothetical protein